MTEPTPRTIKLQSERHWLGFVQWLHGLCILLELPVEQAAEVTSVIGSLSWMSSCNAQDTSVLMRYEEATQKLTIAIRPLREDDLDNEESTWPASLVGAIREQPLVRFEQPNKDEPAACVIDLPVPDQIEPQLIKHLESSEPGEGVEEMSANLIFDRYQDILELAQAMRSARLNNDELTKELAETNEGVLALYGVLEDKAAKLSELNRTLEHRVNVRTAEAENRAEQLRALVSQLVHAEHRERKRLALTLHDHLQQLLVAARMRVELVRAHGSKPKDTGDSDDLGSVLELLDESISVSRDLTVELSPPVLHQSGLVPALHWLADRFQTQYEMQVEVTLDGPEPEIDQEQRLLLFQAIQELLFNVVKHAKVSQAQIRINNREVLPMTVEVVDQGQGVDADKVLKSNVREGHFGVLNIVERMEWLGGRLEIDSEIGRGTTMRLIIPQKQGELEAPVGVDMDEQMQSPVLPRMDEMHGVMGSQLIRVVIIDDHKMLREGLRMILDQQDDMDVVAESEDGLEGLKVCKEQQPDVALMDVNMPRLDGIEATRRVRREAPRVRVIGLSMHDSADIAQAMREAGAVNYLTKGVSPDELCAAVREAARLNQTSQN